MITVGAFEAKTHLSALLDRVETGQDVLITRHGKAIARLVKADRMERQEVASVIAQLKDLRNTTRLEGDWKSLRDEGRR